MFQYLNYNQFRSLIVILYSFISIDFVKMNSIQKSQFGTKVSGTDVCENKVLPYVWQVFSCPSSCAWNAPKHMSRVVNKARVLSGQLSPYHVVFLSFADKSNLPTSDVETRRTKTKTKTQLRLKPQSFKYCFIWYAPGMRQGRIFYSKCCIHKMLCNHLRWKLELSLLNCKD